jgi:quercetin dioxygenase-like cupin family protein
MSQKEVGRNEPLVIELTDAAGRQSLLNGPPQTWGMRSGCVTLAPGQEIGQHTTEAHEEALVVLAGEGAVRLEGRDELRVRAGTIAYVPPHTLHNVVSASGATLRYIYIVAPVAE